MAPSAFVVMERLPRTISGKIDRKALPLPGLAQSQALVEYVAPRTPVEAAVADLWTELLGVERISIHDSFFQLGGHSLLATQLLARVRDAFMVEIALRQLFESPTISGLALGITQAQVEQEDDLEMASMIEGLKDLPDDLLEQMLKEETQLAKDEKRI
jgi:acyl carrier protein